MGDARFAFLVGGRTRELADARPLRPRRRRVLVLVLGGATPARAQQQGAPPPAPPPTQQPGAPAEERLTCRACLAEIPGPCFVVEGSGERDGAYCLRCGPNVFHCTECDARPFEPLRRTPGGRIIGRLFLSPDGVCGACVAKKEEAANPDVARPTIAPVPSAAPTTREPPGSGEKRRGLPVAAYVVGAALVLGIVALLATRQTEEKRPVRPVLAASSTKGAPGAPRALTGRFDPTLGDELAKRLRVELQRGEWKSVDSQLAKLAAEKRWADREFLLEAVADWPGRPAFLDAWVKAVPASTHALLVRGRHSINWAWEARGTAKADALTPDQLRVFGERLQAAEKDFSEAAARAADDPAPWAFLCHSARGLDVDLAEKKKRLEEARTRDPWSRVAHENALRSLLAKWGGSHDEAFALARDVAARAPEGHPVHELVPIAHVERWLYARSFENDAALAGSYWNDPQVKAEVLAAYARSLGSSAYVPGRSSAIERNQFAFAFYLLGETELAKKECDRIGAALTEWPWTYVGDPREQFRKAREGKRFTA